MTARVSPTDVKKVINTSIADDDVLVSMIDTAHLLVDEELLSGSGLSEDRLTKVELYLAAHYVALTDEQGGLTRSKLGDADESYANIYSAGLNATRFGQAAISLDSSGTLARVASSGLKAVLRVV